jgi:hypothetical protein
MKRKQAEDKARAHFYRPSKATVDINALPSNIATLNALAVFSGQIRFKSVRRRGPMTIATTSEGREIVWPTTADLGSFPKSQAIIADATDIFLPAPDYRMIRKNWDAAAALVLKIAAGDRQTLDNPLKEETRDLLRLMWRSCGQPEASAEAGADKNARFIGMMRAVLGSHRDPNGSPPPCVFVAEEYCWVHVPTLRHWLSLTKFTNKLYPLTDIRNGLMLLGFVYRENLTRRCEKPSRDSETCCLWRGPLDVLIDGDSPESPE